ANPRALTPSDTDRDGDLDLVIAHGKGLTVLDNLRQGTFEPVGDLPVAATKALSSVITADLDNDGRPDLVTTSATGLDAWNNQGGTFTSWPLPGLPEDGAYRRVLALDADNDGRLDLVTAGEAGVIVLGQKSTFGMRVLPIDDAPSTATDVATADLDGDGDLDLLVAGPEGLHRLTNQGGDKNNHLAIRLVGLDRGSSKNNRFGVGSVVEVRNGTAYQFREATGDVVHFGLGTARQAEVMRVEWTNGVPQNRLALAGNQTLVEEQLLKGSCPFVYAWNGERFTFVTDLLWGAPIGLPAAPGVYVGADVDELVRLDDLVPSAEGHYWLRVTEELWEAAFFDQIRLWVVDHPNDVEAASNLRIVPGRAFDDEILASRGLRPVVQAIDGRGQDVTAEVRMRDEVYADGYTPSRHQGVAAEPWTFTFDLGVAPAAPVRLHLDGWIFPADASLNLAVAQRDDLPNLPPRLEVETVFGWKELMPSMGFPAGKTKTMVVDTPALPPGARKLRFTTSLWLHWDRIAWTTQPVDDEPKIVAQLDPSRAELRERGVSRMVRSAPNGPHVFLYDEVRPSPWLTFPGRYTKLGDVRPLLRDRDDLSVIMAAGDEMVLEFDASELPQPKDGWRRTVFLESVGWDKDADRNTGAGQQVEPYPFHGMPSYPYPPELYPDTPAHRDYVKRWLTRVIE
ncbi:MAG: CRTAC1 family protein, partial [Acidobacteriota bacterium]